jgi:hypothetical protein
LPLGTAILRVNDLDNPHWWMGAAIGILVAYVVVGNVVLNVALRLLNGPLPILPACFHRLALIIVISFFRSAFSHLLHLQSCEC